MPNIATCGLINLANRILRRFSPQLGFSMLINRPLVLDPGRYTPSIRLVRPIGQRNKLPRLGRPIRDPASSVRFRLTISQGFYPASVKRLALDLGLTEMAELLPAPVR
jgi:hypothetical protein